MDTHELLQKITALPLIAASLAEDLLAGNFRSVFKGSGLEFDEVRHYQWGDDVRSIDWNASARFGTPFVKMYREERELTILLLIDISASMRRGGEGVSPYEQAVITAALIAFSAERTGQRVGAFFFDRGIERVFPPRKGRRHIMSIVGAALQYHGGAARRPAGNDGSTIRDALTGAGRLLKRRSMVILISDFLSVNWEGELGGLCRKHDCVAIRISDSMDEALPDMGLITMEDPETGLRISAPTGHASFTAAWSQWHRERAGLWLNLCRRAGASHLELPSSADAAAALFRFFGAERKKDG